MPVDRDHRFAEDRLHLRVLQTRLVTLWPWWTYPDRMDDFWRIYIHTADGAAIGHGRRRIAMPAWRAVVVPAGVRFSCHAVPDVEQLYLHVDPLGLSGMTARKIFACPFVAPADAAIRTLAERLGEDLGRPASAAVLCQAKALAYLVLSAQMRALPVQTASRALQLMEGDGAMAPALHLVDERLGQPLPNRLLAQACGISLDRFLRRFRDEIGQSPAQYVRDRRVAVGAQRLLYGDETIDDIARACGFGSRYYFTRVFARRMGIGPAAYRRKGTA
ncbi:MAG: helix-turn-helix transcriptional regulator [Planctomycetes bacterium]|nr:helix-turn-helix transcriptional regulator [Planctomycetota bacterium]